MHSVKQIKFLIKNWYKTIILRLLKTNFITMILIHLKILKLAVFQKFKN